MVKAHIKIGSKQGGYPEVKILEPQFQFILPGFALLHEADSGVHGPSGFLDLGQPLISQNAGLGDHRMALPNPGEELFQTQAIARSLG